MVDAVLLVSFGGPESSDQIVPFLRRVTAGRGVPDERLAEVAVQYEALGGRSPINDQNRLLARQLETELERTLGQRVPVALGNRNSEPWLADALADLSEAGHDNVAVVITSGYSSYSGCRQYRENLWDALEQVRERGLTPPSLVRVRRWFDHPGVVDAVTDHADHAFQSLGISPSAVADGRFVMLFSTHSLPVGQAAAAGDPTAGGHAYVRQHQFVVDAVTDRLSQRWAVPIRSELVFQSRSGPPRVPWLEPDVSERIEALAGMGVEGVVVVPIGFATDHMEVLWDLDHLARQAAATAGVAFARAATVGSDERFAVVLADMVREIAVGVPPCEQAALGPDGAAAGVCPASCCSAGPTPRPALFEGETAVGNSNPRATVTPHE